MLDLSENLRKLILAGVGVAAVTKEKGADVLNELVKKGELTIEQGKVLNEELKHNIKDAIRENVTIVTPPDDVISAVDSLSDEQLEALKASDGYLFNENKFAGFQPGGDGKVPGISSTWEARLADARKNNNQLEAIKIKQEAAAEGVVLI